jgi:hypothetical protein
MVVWAAIAAVAAACIIGIAVWVRSRHRADGLDYEDFVQLGRAAWIDLRDDERTRDSRSTPR